MEKSKLHLVTEKVTYEPGDIATRDVLQVKAREADATLYLVGEAREAFAQWRSDSWVLQELIGRGLVDAETAAQLQLEIGNGGHRTTHVTERGFCHDCGRQVY